MSNNTVSQYIFKNFGNYDLTRAMDKGALEDADEMVQSTEATVVVVGDGTLRTSVKPAVVGDTTWSVLPSLLKEQNPKMYEALKNPKAIRSLGPMSKVAGPDTTTFTDVVLIKGLDSKGSYNKFTNIVVKLQK